MQRRVVSKTATERFECAWLSRADSNQDSNQETAWYGTAIERVHSPKESFRVEIADQNAVLIVCPLRWALTDSNCRHLPCKSQVTDSRF